MKNNEDIIKVDISKEEIEKAIKNTELKRIREVVLKTQKFIGTKKSLADFREPVVELIRRDGTVEYYEDQRGTLFWFKHSDGTKRFITLGHNKLKAEYGKNNSYSKYICHEDHPIPLPNKPVATVEAFNDSVDRVFSTNNKWNTPTDTSTEFMKWAKNIGIVVGVVFVVYIVAVGVLPGMFPEWFGFLSGMNIFTKSPPVQAIAEPVVETVKQNITVLSALVGVKLKWLKEKKK